MWDAQGTGEALLKAFLQLQVHLEQQGGHLNRHRARRRKELDETDAPRRADGGAAGARPHAMHTRASMPHHAVPCNAMQCYAMPCKTLSHAGICSAATMLTYTAHPEWEGPGHAKALR